MEEAPLGSTSWRVLFSIPMQFVGRVQLVRQGLNDVYVAVFKNPPGGAQNEQTTVYVSHNAGVTWSTRADPCGYSGSSENDAEAITAAPQSVVAVLCYPRQGGGPVFVAVSSDGGKGFGHNAPLPDDVGFGLIAATCAAFRA